MTVTLTRAGFCLQRAWFADRSSLFRVIRFPAMVAIINHEKLGTILFDTGYGRALEEAASARLYRRLLPFALPERERIAARLAQFGVAKVDRVFLSHFHPDHIGGLREVPGSCPILHSRAGLVRLRTLRGLALRRSAFFAELLPDDFEARGLALEDLPLVECAGLGPAYDVAGDGTLLAVPLPGHAAGQYGLLCQLEGGARVLLCADAAWLRSNIDQSGDATEPRPEGAVSRQCLVSQSMGNAFRAATVRARSHLVSSSGVPIALQATKDRETFSEPRPPGSGPSSCFNGAGDLASPTGPTILEAPIPGGRGSKAVLGLGINGQGTRPAWPVRLLADDYAQFHQTLDRLDAFVRAFPDVRIIPSHCEESIGPID